MGDMIDRIGSLLGFYDESNGKQEADVRKLVDEKAKKFGWERCDEEPGVVLPKKNGKLCLTPQGLKDVVWSELEMIRKGPFECAFPLENGRNVVHLLDGKLPRSERLVEWWEEAKAVHSLSMHMQWSANQLTLPLKSPKSTRGICT